jgi:hypothetical protein
MKKFLKMTDFDFYKEFYFYELKRKDDLYNMINIPLLLITGIISIHLYFLEFLKTKIIIIIAIIVVIFTSFLILKSIFYLISSYSNKLKMHEYKEIAGMNDLYQYKSSLNMNNINENDEVFFNNLKVNLSECAQHNFIINKTRTEQIAKAKTSLILSLISTLIFIIISLIAIIIQ